MKAQPGPATASAFLRKASRQPLLWAAVAYGSGIVLGAHAWRPILWWIAAGIVFCSSAAYFARRRSGLAWSLALGAFFLAGAFQVHATGGLARLDSSIQPFADGQEIEITAHVTRDGRLQPAAEGESRETFEVETEEIRTDAGVIASVHSGVRLSIYAPNSNLHASEAAPAETDGNATTAMPIFSYGERIRVVSKLRRPRNFRNPGAFDFEGYLASRGIAALGSAKLQNVHRLPGFSGSRFGYWRSRFHRSVVSKVHQLWPAREAALIDAMIVGEDAFIDRDTRAGFQRSGTYHVLVVSGMNVSILAFVVFWTLRRLRLPEIPATLLAIGLCVGYAFITEVGTPVWRATLMCGVYLGTRLLYRDRAMVNAIGAAGLALLIFDPRQIFSASFQMTFVCVLIVAAIGVPVLERTSQFYKRGLKNWDSNDYAALLPPKAAQFRVEMQFIAGRLGRFVGKTWGRRLTRGSAALVLGVWELVFISAVLQMGLALPMAYYFHRATTVGLPANFIVVPLTELMMPSALTALLLGYTGPWLARVPVFLTTLALHGVTGTVRGMGDLRLAEFRVPVPSMSIMAFAAAAFLFAVWSVRRQFAWAALGLASLLSASLLLTFVAPPQPVLHGVLQVTSIDVGEGDSTLVITPEGRTLLIDAGGPIGRGGTQLDFGEDVVSPYLWAIGISRLDAVAITHGHSDHIGGILAVLKNFKPKELWIGLEPPHSSITDMIRAAQGLDIKVVRRWEGDEFGFGGSTIAVLYPPQGATAGDRPRNNDSLILRASYGDSSVLLEGDAEKQVERYVAAIHHPIASLLKVGHHGSANATTPELLNSARPQFAVISVGAGNSFGLPRMETLARLQAAGVRVYRTDLDGNVTFYLDGRSVKASVASLH